jgi:hypothetical protein
VPATAEVAAELGEGRGYISTDQKEIDRAAGDHIPGAIEHRATVSGLQACASPTEQPENTRSGRRMG